MGERGAVHHLPGAFAGHRGVLPLARAELPAHVSRRQVPAEHAADHRPPRPGAIPDRGADHRRSITRDRRPRAGGDPGSLFFTSKTGIPAFAGTTSIVNPPWRLNALLNPRRAFARAPRMR